MKKTTLFVSALVMLMAAGCKNSGFKKTRSGLIYKIISDGKGQQLKKGNIIKLHFKQTLNDSLLGESYGQMPFYAPVDSVGETYDPQEVFLFLRKGDSAVIIRLADSLSKKQGPLPEFIKPKDKLILSIKVLDVFTSDSAAQADRSATMAQVQQGQQEEFEKRKVSVVKEMEEYFAKNNIQYQKAPKGTYVVIKDPGTGPKADSGKTAMVLYKGTMFPSGKQFETNMEEGKNPYPVVVGTHSVIEGWDEGLQYFAKGGKGTLYVPFFLAYGSQPRPLNTPYANLVFDIEIADVTDGAPQMPPPPPPPAQK